MPRARFALDFERIYLEAAEAKLEEKLEDELASFARLMREHYAFKLFLEDSRIAVEYKKKMLAKLCPPGISANFLSIVHMLIDFGREDLVEDFSLRFTKRIYKDKGILFGEVTSVCAFGDKTKERLQKVLEEMRKSKIKLRYGIDPALLGGICIKFVNGEVLDISLKHKLNDLKAAILS